MSRLTEIQRWLLAAVLALALGVGAGVASAAPIAAPDGSAAAPAAASGALPEAPVARPPSDGASQDVVPLDGAAPIDPVPQPAGDDLPQATPTPSSGVSGGGAWQLRLSAFADTVGVGGYRCQGCDRRYGDADAMAAAGMPLPPLYVVVRAPGDLETVYWRGTIERDRGSPTTQEMVTVHAAPPYEVELITTHMPGYVLCPNSASSVIVTQAAMDRLSGARPGQGRAYPIDWFLWRCRAELE